MGVDDSLEIVYDLASLNESQAEELIQANEKIIKEAELQKSKKKELIDEQRKEEEKLIPKEEEREEKEKEGEKKKEEKKEEKEGKEKKRSKKDIALDKDDIKEGKKKKPKQLDDREREKEQKETDKRLDELEKEQDKSDELKNAEIAEELPLDQLGAQSGLSFFIRQFKSSLPVIGPIIAVSSFFVNELLKLDALNKKFLDIANTRINAFVDRQQQALLDNHLEQIIYTTKAGTTAPRDSYNSFNNYDRVLKIEGRDRDASSIGGVD